MATRRSPAVLLKAAANERTIFQNGVIEFWTGAQPVSASNPMTGTLVATATLSGGAFTPGAPTNGLTLAAPVLVGGNAVLAKPAGELWQFAAVAAGTVNSARYKANAIDANGESTTHDRLDMSVSLATGTGEVKMAKLTYALADIGDIQTMELTFSNPLPV